MTKCKNCGHDIFNQLINKNPEKYRWYHLNVIDNVKVIRCEVLKPNEGFLLKQKYIECGCTNPEPEVKQKWYGI